MVIVDSACDLPDCELHTLGQGLAAIFTTRCPESQDLNEDSCALIPFDSRSGILVVADGAGGLPSGGKASEITIAAMRSALRSAAKRQGELRSAVLDGIEAANRGVMGLGVGAATTLAAPKGA